METYTEITVSPGAVRDEVQEYLRDNKNSLVLPIPTRLSPAGMQREWYDRTRKAGKPVNDFVNDIYIHLISSDRAKRTQKETLSSAEKAAYDAYYPTQIKFLILEEVWRLVHTGVLIDVAFEPVRELSFDFKFSLGKGNLVLTNFGVSTLGL